MWGALVPGREGSLLSARLRYFDPVRRRAGVPEDVGALVSELTDDRTVVTLVNVSQTNPRTVVVQGGGYGEHQIVSAEVNGQDHADQRARFHGATRARRRSEADAGDETLRESADCEVPLGKVMASGDLVTW